MERKMIVCAVLLLLVISAAGFSGCLDDEEEVLPNTETPEDVFASFVKTFNDRDGEGAVRLTDHHFYDTTYSYSKRELDEFVNEIKIENKTVSSFEIFNITYEDDMDADEQNFFLRLMMWHLSDSFDIEFESIEEFCIIDGTVSWSSGEVDNITFPLVKIDGEWFVPASYYSLREISNRVAAEVRYYAESLPPDMETEEFNEAIQEHRLYIEELYRLEEPIIVRIMVFY